MRTALYRHFDAAGRLLYVGISLSAVQRLAQHRLTAHWFERIARIEIEWRDSREEALIAEIQAIARERPECNTAHVASELKSEAAILPACKPLSCDTYAIEHRGSGRRDGNYFNRDEADDHLAWWCATYPLEQFHLVVAPAGDLTRPGGATNFAPVLRPFESHLWKTA
jgi:excinuclease UvrABC nuclease subunit